MTAGSRRSCFSRCQRESFGQSRAVLPWAACPAHREKAGVLLRASEMQPRFTQRQRKHQRGGQAAKTPHTFPLGPFPAQPRAQCCPSRHPGTQDAGQGSRAGEEELFISKTKVHCVNQDYKEQEEKKKPATTLFSKC